MDQLHALQRDVGRAPHEPGDLVAVGEQHLAEERAVLARDAGDQSSHGDDASPALRRGRPLHRAPQAVVQLDLGGPPELLAGAGDVEAAALELAGRGSANSGSKSPVARAAERLDDVEHRALPAGADVVLAVRPGLGGAAS